MEKPHLFVTETARPTDQGRRGDHRQVAAGALAGGAHLRADPGPGAYRFYQGKIAECHWEIEAQLGRFEGSSDGGPLASNGRRRSQGNAPRFHVRTHLYRMTGVDLTRIDDVDAYTALRVISEIGTDMTKWPSAKHFASWLGLSPNNRITSGKVMSSKTKPSANRAATTLRLAANALHRSDNALGAFLRRKKAHMGAPKASPPQPTSWPGSSIP